MRGDAPGRAGTRRGSFLKKAPPNPRKDFQRILVWCEHTGLHNKRKPTNGRLLSVCRQSSESFRPPFSKGGAVEGAEPSSPSADGETLLSALSFCSFAKQSVLFSLRQHGQRKSVVQNCSFLGITLLVLLSVVSGIVPPHFGNPIRNEGGMQVADTELSRTDL